MKFLSSILLTAIRFMKMLISFKQNLFSGRRPPPPPVAIDVISAT